MSNILIFWKESSDPPSPWTRLTRQGKYIRLTDSAANHLGSIGAATHDHDDSMDSFIIGPCEGHAQSNAMSSLAMGIHGHTNPSSYAISSANNDPAYYGLDLIYMDFGAWKASYRTFPDGAVVLSSQSLADASLARFSDADGKYLVNSTPGATGGSTGTRNHVVTASSGRGSSGVGGYEYGSVLSYLIDHGHSISLPTSGNTNEPRTLTTRLYEILAMLMAKEGMVAFCDGTPDGDWEILSGWKDANLKSGNSDPTLSGSDTHAETVSGNTSGADDGGNTRGSGGDSFGVSVSHTHPVSGTLKTVSHVPLSCYLMPIRLTKSYSLCRPRAQIIGLW